MAASESIKTYFEGTWHDGDVPVMRAADHGAWLGSSVFDGARAYDGLIPDLDAHCARINASADALMIDPTHGVDEMIEIIREGVALFPRSAALYVRPMYWAIDSDPTVVAPARGKTGFSVCLEEIPFAPRDAAATLATTRFRRPVLESSVVNAKAGCLYPNNCRMLAEAKSKGYSNALVADAMGNVAESATSNVFMVRDGEILTPIANGTFLAGITRARHMANLAADGTPVREAVLTFDDFRAADEVFLSGNLNKVTPVSEFDGTHYNVGPVTRRVREMYFDWARSAA